MGEGVEYGLMAEARLCLRLPGSALGCAEANAEVFALHLRHKVLKIFAAIILNFLGKGYIKLAPLFLAKRWQRSGIFATLRDGGENGS